VGDGTIRNDLRAPLTAKSRRLHCSVGMVITDAIHDTIGTVPANVWTAVAGLAGVTIGTTA